MPKHTPNRKPDAFARAHRGDSKRGSSAKARTKALREQRSAKHRMQGR